jgi:hypothetical protein
VGCGTNKSRVMKCLFFLLFISISAIGQERFFLVRNADTIIYHKAGDTQSALRNKPPRERKNEDTGRKGLVGHGINSLPRPKKKA